MNELDINEESLKIDLKKIFLMFWCRKVLLIRVFLSIFIFFVLLTFISTKKYTVEADLYVNKANNTNMAEINPYALDESSGLIGLSNYNSALLNEIEIIQSPLVINKVIIENDLRNKKLFGIFTTKKTGKYITTEKFLKKKFKIENKKGTNVITISYKHKDRELAYNILNSVITNYMELYKELNSEKSKSDKKIIEAEYKKAKTNLDKKMQSASGLPSTSLSGTGNLAAMSAFSKSAQNAIAQLQGQYVAGEKSQLSVKEDADRVAYLSSKLEWANLVEEMSDSSKVLVLKEPRLLEEYEQTSPKLLINIILGIIFGGLGALLALLIAENTDKKLSYSMLGDNIIYDLDKETKLFYAYLLTNKNKRILFAFCGDVPNILNEKFKIFSNVFIMQAGISDSFATAIQNSDQIVMFAQIEKTNSEDYKIIKNMIKDNNKEIAYEVLV